MSYGQILDVAAWQQARRREFLPMKLFVVSGSLAVALLMGTLCAGWFTMLLLGADGETVLTGLTGTTYFAYWQARHSSDLVAQIGAIWQGGLLGYGLSLVPWSAIAILSSWPTLKRSEVLVAERDPMPLPDLEVRVPPALSSLVDCVLNPNPPNEAGTPIMVGKPSKPDRLHDLNVLRMMRAANERTVRDVGPLPAGGVPVAPKRKTPRLPSSWRWKPTAEIQADTGVLDEALTLAYEENDAMKWKQMAAAAVVATGALTACAHSASHPEVTSHSKDFSGEWSVKWCDKDDPGTDCGGFSVYLVQEGERVCGNYFGARVGLAQIDEGVGRTISGVASEGEAELTVESSRSNAIYLVRSSMRGDVMTWRVIKTVKEGGSDMDLIAYDDRLQRSSGVSERYLEAVSQCSK